MCCKESERGGGEGMLMDVKERVKVEARGEEREEERGRIVSCNGAGECTGYIRRRE